MCHICDIMLKMSTRALIWACEKMKSEMVEMVDILYEIDEYDLKMYILNR